MNQSARISEFHHTIGAHCSSTSIANLLRYDGIEMSEAMAFGLGAGLGFWYIHNDNASPTHRFNGRAPDLEGNFYRHIGHPIDWAGRWSPVEMFASIHSGRPLLAQSDIYYLPYYQPQVHFIGHGVVVTAIDLAQESVELMDIYGPEPLTVALDDFRQAIGTSCPPIFQSYHWGAAPKIAPDIATSGAISLAIPRAIKQAAKQMLHPSDKVLGIPAMQSMAATMPQWGNEADFAWIARFGYQAIEKRGTGGGGFRTLYAAFLAEAEAYVPPLAKICAAKRMRDLGSEWSRFAALLKRIFIEENPAHFGAAAEVVGVIVEQEGELMRELFAMVE